MHLPVKFGGLTSFLSTLDTVSFHLVVKVYVVRHHIYVLAIVLMYGSRLKGSYIHRFTDLDYLSHLYKSCPLTIAKVIQAQELQVLLRYAQDLY